MRRHKFILGVISLIFLPLTLIALTPIPGNCKEGKAKVVTSLLEEGLHEIKRKEKTTLSKILETENILSINYWNFLSVEDKEETFLCVVTGYTLKMGKDIFPDRILSFYKKTDDKFEKIYEFISGDSFLGMYPMGEVNGNLFTVWGGATSYHFEIFSLIDKKIRLVLESGSKVMPEIADIDNDEEPEILLSYGYFKPDGKDDTAYTWETTDIYKWNGKFYKLTKTVPWESRFDTLKPKTGEVGKH